MAIPIIKPLLGEAEAEAAKRAILSGWITQGPEVAAFEREFAEAVGAPHAVAVSNCTTALHLSLLGAGVGDGDEVITVSHSFIATANAVRYLNAVPVFVDIDPATCNLDPAKLDAAFTPKTRAILCVHQAGMPCDMKTILAKAAARGIPVVEDAACAIGSEADFGQGFERIGKPRGLAACFSFHPRKIVTTGDGGMITTADASLAAKLRLWRQHGMSVPDLARHQANQVIFEGYECVGFNYRMTDIQGAVGREQLRRLPAIIERRRAQAARYRERLAGLPKLALMDEPSWARSNWQTFLVRLDASLDQRAVMQQLLDAGISTRRGIMCTHLEPAYAPGKAPWRAAAELTESERATRTMIALPLYHTLTEAEHDQVIEQVRRAVQ